MFLNLETLAIVSERAAVLVGYCGIFIIVLGCLKGMLLLVRKLLQNERSLASIRMEVGQYLVLGLEFLVGKDIVESLIRPTWDDLGKLAFIILLRTALTFFLAKEMQEAREEVRDEMR